MAAALRSLRKLQQVQLLPRISVTSVRAESGGKSSPHTEIGKTLVSFPVKVSHFQQPATGENRNEPLRPGKAALLDVAESGGQSDREMQPGQKVSHDSAQSVCETSHKDDDDSSSSSSSDSSSDSESEGEDKGTGTEPQANNGESGGGHKGLPSAAQKSFSSPGHMSLEQDRPIKEGQKKKMGMRGVNTEELQDFAPVVNTKEQSLHTTSPSTKMTPAGTDKMEVSGGTVPIEGASSTAADSEEIKILSSSFSELPTDEVVILTPESGETQFRSTTTSQELLVGSVKMSAAESRETRIPLPTTSEELSAGGEEMLSPKSMETQILSTATSEELPVGEVETLAPESVETKIPLSSTSEELLVEVETLTPESVETEILLAATSEELLVEEGAAELHESHSPPEPCAASPEPFDNTKYQNLQHFNYTPFTFIDLDVEMAKYRLPQPSAGRPSPRH